MLLQRTSHVRGAKRNRPHAPTVIPRVQEVRPGVSSAIQTRSGRNRTSKGMRKYTSPQKMILQRIGHVRGRGGLRGTALTHRPSFFGFKRFDPAHPQQLRHVPKEIEPRKECESIQGRKKEL
ncbi:hypothetical protein CDAR_47531 [Caerostris darwini]|uniref:Uncharacterized protein n=1 Tax=Caerostris darwini TaxID=1538125 RepID=A0AAV4M9Q5_9ARAC|nr:hypothetical protein CDAR_47531 [Caerostris darwini]